MIQALIVKAIFNAIYKAIQKKHNLKKMEDYVNKPNELDKQMKQVQKNLNKALKYIEVLEKDVGTLTLLVCVSSKKTLSKTTIIVLQCIL